MKRNYSIDLLRIFCCYCIIMLHASAHLDSTGNFWRLVQGVVRPALWCFLSLSGYFILSKPIVKWSEFYFRHLLHLLIPLVFYTFIYQLYYSNGGGISLLAILAGDSVGHLWFVYSLTVLYILAPFLQKMLTNLTIAQLNGLLITMFFCGRIINIMTALGVGIGIPISVIGNCDLFFFILGYWLFRTKVNVSCKIILPLLIINIIYCGYTFTNPILINGTADLSLSMVSGVLLYFFLFSKLFASWHNGLKIIEFVSARTYGIYLIHMLIFQYFIVSGILELDPYSHSHLWVLPLKCFVIFVLGLLFSTVIDFIICNPVEKVMQRIIGHLYGKCSKAAT